MWSWINHWPFLPFVPSTVRFVSATLQLHEYCVTLGEQKKFELFANLAKRTCLASQQKSAVLFRQYQQHPLWPAQTRKSRLENILRSYVTELIIPAYLRGSILRS